MKHSRAKYMKRYRKTNPEKVKGWERKRSRTERRMEYQRKRRLERMRFLRSYKKGRKCVKCGWNKHTEILEPHHRNPSEKEFDFSKSQLGNLKMERIIKELNKCDLLCPNCHRWLHFKEKAKL